MKKINKTALSAALAVALSAGLFSNVAKATVNDTVFFRALPMVIVWGANNYAETAGIAPVVSDFLLLTGASGTAGVDITAGNVFPVVTGTLTPVSNGSVATNGNLIAITGPTAAPAGGGVLTDNATTGVLNAADTLTAFGINAATSVGFATNSTKSFYVASNTAYDIYAQSGTATTSGDFTALTTSSIQLNMVQTLTGTDGGLAFGGSAQNPTTGGGLGFIGLPATLNTLATPTKIYDGGRRTAGTAGSIAAQSVRYDITYTLVGGYGLQMGAGSISVPMTYTVYVP